MSSDRIRQAICTQVAQILREERLKRGLSLTIVADRAGLSHQMVSFVEREMRKPTLDTLLRITAVLEISLAEVIGTAVQFANRNKIS